MASIIRADALQNTNTSNIISQTNATTLTIGASGQTISLASGASSSGFGATYNGAVNWTSNVVTSALTLSAGIGYWVNTSSAAITATLPASASVGDTIILTDFNRTWGTNNLTLSTNALNFQGNTSPNPVYNTAGQTVQLVYSGATQGWIPTSDDNVTLQTPQSYSIDFLVVAGGGGGGGGAHGGGGGAGGYRTSTQGPLSRGVVITVTVGDGGAGSSIGVKGVSGSSSSISGTGLTTITSAGGGGGGSQNIDTGNGASGGSGGGAGNSGTAGTGGSGNTPSTSPSQGNNGGNGNYVGPNYGAAGGGGANAVGGNGTNTTGGNGGAGTASSITGSSVTRAGGGGGSTYGGGTAGSGGAGGGGAGGANANGTAGTANTGGGGGGGANTSDTAFGAAGGKGVVILSVPTSSYSGTTTGNPTVTTSGSNTIMQFDGSGSYTT
jgi:hypothetical protein